MAHSVTEMYKENLTSLRNFMARLHERTDPGFLDRVKQIESVYRDRLRTNDIVCGIEFDMAQEEYERETQAALKEFDEQSTYLKEHLVNELQEKAKAIEQEQSSCLELRDYADSLDNRHGPKQPMSTRKLRRRPATAASDSMPGVCNGNGHLSFTSGGDTKRVRKTLQLSSMTYLLDDSAINEDLKCINGAKAGRGPRMPARQPNLPESPSPPHDSDSNDSHLSNSSSTSPNSPTSNGSPSAEIASPSSSTDSLSPTSPPARAISPSTTSLANACSSRVDSAFEDSPSLSNVDTSSDCPLPTPAFPTISSEASSTTPPSSSSLSSPSPGQAMLRIVDGKLFYNRRWFRRGQAVYLIRQAEDTSEGGGGGDVTDETSASPEPRRAATINSIGSEGIMLRLAAPTSAATTTTTNNQSQSSGGTEHPAANTVKVELGQLSSGQYIIERRGTTG